MRYGKKQVNKIIDRILSAAYATELGLENSVKFEHELEMIKEEHLLIDRRVSSLPEYTTEIVQDFIDYKLSYKDIMLKYKCSQRNLRGLLAECADNDERVWQEIELRRRD